MDCIKKTKYFLTLLLISSGLLVSATEYSGIKINDFRINLGVISQPSLNIMGKIASDKGDILSGVSITVKGKKMMSKSNNDGSFEIEVTSMADTLIFTHLGFETQEFAVNGRSDLSIILIENDNNLDEVVIVGYGTQKKVNLTGSVAVISGKELAQKQTVSTSAALQGLAPGLMVTQQSGQPGADAGRIRIRGISSMFAGQTPLVLVDNVEMSIDAIDPNNISSISVLKDAAASSIYGSRAASGVILITTKRGEHQGIVLTYNGYVGKQDPTNLPQKMDALGHMELWDQALINMNREPVYTESIQKWKETGPDNFELFNTEWEKLTFTNDNMMNSHNVSINSKNDFSNIYASGNYLLQNGLTPNTSLKKIGLRINSDFNISKKLTASLDLGINNDRKMAPVASNPEELVRAVIGLPANLSGQFDTGEWGDGWVNINPAAKAHDGGTTDLKTNTLILSGNLKYLISDKVKIAANYSTRDWKPHSKTFYRQYQIYKADPVNQELIPAAKLPSENRLSESRGQNTQNTFRTQFDYQDKYLKNQWQFLAGFMVDEFKGANLQAGRNRFTNPDLPYINLGEVSTVTNGGGYDDWAIVSAFSRINYQYAEKYLMELNGRLDGSSRFSRGNRWSFFPSLSIGYRLSEEEFWKPMKSIINELKIRSSYGLLGNQNLDSYYPTVAVFAPGYNYYFNDVLNSGLVVQNAANRNIRWETSQQLDIGLDIGMFENKLNITAEWYKKKIYDLLQKLPIPLSVGLAAPYVNAGSIENQGWDLAINWNDNIGAVNYAVRLNLSDVKNKVINLSGREYIAGLTIKKEGYALDSYYGYQAEGLFQSEEEIANSPFHFANTAPGDIKYQDISGPEGIPDGIIDNFDRTILGNSYPRYEGSINLDLNWKNFDLSLFFQGVGKRNNYLSENGAWAFYSGAFQGTVFEHHQDNWTIDNPRAEYPRLTLDIDNNYKNSSYWLKSGKYIRLKNLALGYNIPKSLLDKIQVEQLRVNISAQNLFTLDQFYPGFDPELNDNTGAFYPLMKTYTFGISLKF